jgi:uncharacterized Zn finger protein
VSRTSYGNTGWGAQWLQALAQIDYDSRLPRGRAYANRGAVRDLKVHEGHIRAHVQARAQGPTWWTSTCLSSTTPMPAAWPSG